MPIKITETTDRDCCDHCQDLRPYKGTMKETYGGLKFCVHCGQIWAWVREIDSAGCMKEGLKKIDPDLCPAHHAAHR